METVFVIVIHFQDISTPGHIMPFFNFMPVGFTRLYRYPANKAVYIHWTSTANSHIDPNLPYLHVISNECPKCNQCLYATFAHRLAKIAQTAQTSMHPAPGNDAIVAMMTLTLRKRLLLGIAAWHDFCMKWLTFLQISCKPQLWSQTSLFLWKTNEQTFPTIYCPYGNIVNFSRMSRIHFC